MIKNATRHLAWICVAAATACSSSSSSDGTGSMGSSGGSSTSSGAGDSSVATGSGSGGSSGGSSSTSGSGSGGTVADGGDTEGGLPGGDSGTMDAPSDGGGDGNMVGMGQFDCTMNAGDAMHHVGSEHLGHTLYGVVVDTTVSSSRARVGWVQESVVMADLFVKFVWPRILVAGHTYEIAVFDDMGKNKTCTATDRTWTFPVPMVTGSYVANWMTGHQPYTTGMCQDFPMGPLP